MPAKKNSPRDPSRALVTAARSMLKALEDRDVEAQQAAAESMETALAKIDPPAPTDPGEMLATLEITKTQRRTTSGGAWVSGTIAGHAFEALVFSEHAENPAWELGESRISKLWVKDIATGESAANFDRGWDLKPTTDAARRVVDLLCAGLAETVYGK